MKNISIPITKVSSKKRMPSAVFALPCVVYFVHRVFDSGHVSPEISDKIGSTILYSGLGLSLLFMLVKGTNSLLLKIDNKRVR